MGDEAGEAAGPPPCCPSSTYLVGRCLLPSSLQVAAELHRSHPGPPGLDRCHPGQVGRMKTPGVGPAGAPTPAPSQQPPGLAIQHILLCVGSVREQISRGTDLGQGVPAVGGRPRVREPRGCLVQPLVREGLPGALMQTWSTGPRSGRAPAQPPAWRPRPAAQGPQTAIPTCRTGT